MDVRASSQIIVLVWYELQLVLIPVVLVQCVFSVGAWSVVSVDQNRRVAGTRWAVWWAWRD